jgi:hypothetical protein
MYAAVTSMLIISQSGEFIREEGKGGDLDQILQHVLHLENPTTTATTTANLFEPESSASTTLPHQQPSVMYSS